MLLRIILGGLCGMFCYWLGFFTSAFFSGRGDDS